MYERNGSKLGIRYDDKILEWCIVFLARTSIRTYTEVAEVFKLPHISYIYKLSCKVASRANRRGYSICIQTLETIKQQKLKEAWAPAACFGVMLYDSVSNATGITWANAQNNLIGQDKSHQFLPLTQKFQLRANNEKAALTESSEDTNKVRMSDDACGFLFNLSLTQNYSLVGQE